MDNSAILSSQGVKQHCARRHKNGKIKISVQSKSSIVLKLLVVVLLFLTVYAFYAFDYKEIQLGEAIAATFHNMKTVFLEPKLSTGTIQNVLYQLLITLCLGTLSTIFGAILAFFCSLLCAKNLAPAWIANLVKSFVALVRAVPTVLWVLIFAVSAGLGSVAAVIGLTFHSFAYLTKVYAESIEEVDAGMLEALRASGANFWQIVFQAVVPASISRLVAWTFMRFEINFTNAVAMGAAAGAGGIGFQLFMAGSFYFNLHEMGFLTYMVVLAVIILEFCSTKMKAKVK